MVTAADRELYEKAKELFNTGRGPQAYKIYEHLAREGDTRCQVFVGWMLYGGNGIEKNEALGLEWFRRASSLGSAVGAFYCGKALGMCGKDSEALAFFRQSSEQGYGPGLLWLGISYVRGCGVPVDFEKGLAYLKRSADLGNFLARRELAMLMIKGKLGLLKIPVGLFMLPYFTGVAIVDGWRNGESERLLG